MKISLVKKMEAKLEKFKESMDTSLRFNDEKEEDILLINNLKTKINEIENILLDLKSTNNSSAAKIIKWFKTNLILISPYLEPLSKFSATESAFTFVVSTTSLGLDLSRLPGSWTPTTPLDMKKYENLCSSIYVRTRSLSNPLKEKLNNPYLSLHSISTSSFDYQNSGISFQFNYSKKLLQKSATTDQFLRDVCIEIANYLNYLRHELADGKFDQKSA